MKRREGQQVFTFILPLLYAYRMQTLYGTSILYKAAKQSAVQKENRIIKRKETHL